MTLWRRFAMGVCLLVTASCGASSLSHAGAEATSAESGGAPTVDADDGGSNAGGWDAMTVEASPIKPTSGGPGSTGLVHPGGLLTQDEMDHIRANVAAGTQPWAAAFMAIENSDASANYQPSVAATISDDYALQNQGHAAYVLAIKWVASGDSTYAVASIRILDAWVDTVQSMTTDTLRTGIGAVQMANAAEIMAYAFHGGAGWPAASISRAKAWFGAVVWPRIGAANAQRSSNWGTSAMAGCMATAIFADDRAKFDYSVGAFENGFTDAPDGCSGVAQYICDASGQPTEAGRDQGHAQGGVAHLVEVAMMAWNQGTNLVSYSDSRLVAGMEYLAKYNLGNDVPYDPNFADPCNVHPDWATISSVDRGQFSPIYEVSHKLFVLAGAPHPYTEQVLASAGYRPETTNSDHPGLGTLTLR